MLLIKFFSMLLLLVQGPPAPGNNPPPPGLVPIDENIWVLLLFAIALIVFVVRRKVLKAA